MRHHTNEELMALLTPLAAEYPRIKIANPPCDPAHPMFVRRTAFDMSLILARKGTDITVVDVGGGLGLLSLGFAKLGARSILVDDFGTLPGAAFPEEVFAMFERHGVDVMRRDVIAEGLELPDRVDAVTSFHVLEHVHASPKSVFHAMARSLAPGGLFVLAGPNCVNLRKRVTAVAGRCKWSPMEHWYDSDVFRGHVREPDVDDLRYVGKDLGLRDLAIYGRNFLGSSNPGLQGAAARLIDPILRRRPALCSDIYMVGSR